MEQKATAWRRGRRPSGEAKGKAVRGFKRRGKEGERRGEGKAREEKVVTPKAMAMAMAMAICLRLEP
jgi:hypothetical protein